MMDLEPRVAQSLAARADRPVEVDRLRAGAIRRARGIRRRRRQLVAAGLAFIALLGVASVRAAAPVGRPLPSQRPEPTTLPSAVGVAPAIERPVDIGTDPALLHFDLDLGGLNADITEWVSANGYERAIIYSAAIGQVYIAHTLAALPAVDPTAGRVEQTTVDGRPAALRRIPDSGGGVTWDLRWEPAAGVQAAVFAGGDDPAYAVKVAGTLRLDRAQRCVAPIHLSEMPPGATWIECRIQIAREGAIHSALVLRTIGGHQVQIWLVPTGLSTGFTPNRTVAGRPAEWRDTDTRGLWMPEFGPVDVFISGVEPDTAEWLTEQDAAWLVERIQVVADASEPGTWPIRAVE
jgi:hypothetical protein